MILDHGRPAGAKVVDLMRCLHRVPESWGGTSGRRKVLASKLKFLGRKLETRAIQNTNLATSETRGKILISVNESSVRSRD